MADLTSAIRRTLAWFAAATIAWISWTIIRTRHHRRWAEHDRYERQPY
jgi:hypothetical protein